MEELMKKIQEVKAEIEEKFGREGVHIQVNMSGWVRRDEDESGVENFESHFGEGFVHQKGILTEKEKYSDFVKEGVRFALRYANVKSKAERCAELRRQLEELGCEDE
jgi:hypothetical protein